MQRLPSTGKASDTNWRDGRRELVEAVVESPHRNIDESDFPVHRPWVVDPDCRVVEHGEKRSADLRVNRVAPRLTQRPIRVRVVGPLGFKHPELSSKYRGQIVDPHSRTTL